MLAAEPPAGRLLAFLLFSAEGFVTVRTWRKGGKAKDMNFTWMLTPVALQPFLTSLTV